mmetsp:Transcript_30516/g.59876  ORF Transcript_30516/g.59876 Transcript_30516/m.59876 type:complete len:183 (+) Transcript_30516:80-628(+)
MSSIHDALSRDIHRSSGGFPKPNRVVLRSHQERIDGPVGGGFFARKALEHEQARAMRRAEGGKSGGYFDRQEVVHSRGSEASSVDEDKEVELDEFGRRRSKQQDKGLSRAARAEAALQRIRQQAAAARRIVEGQGSATRRSSSESSPAVEEGVINGKRSRQLGCAGGRSRSRHREEVRDRRH